MKVAIDSVLHASYNNIELIVQDDNSKDNTWEIICNFKDTRIKKDRNLNNIGEYPNRKLALERATGKYVLFLDGDDFIYPHAIEFIVNMFEAFPNCGMATMGVYRPDILYPITLTPHQFIIAELFGDISSKVGFTSNIFKTELLKEVGMPIIYKTGDTYLRRKMGLKAPTLLIGSDLTWWRQTPGQAFQLAINNLQNRIDSFNYTYEFVEEAKNILTVHEYRMAMLNIRRNFISVLKHYIIRGKFKSLIEIIKSIKFKWSIYDFKHKVYRQKLFQDNDVTNPYMLPLKQNPYSKH
ncbi:MAG: glycosyltransferase family 2 protein [Marinilabiliaceae bacterium]|nr:glycosyltransferase family 2 protein [Marinilabiliaceae bacterium]